MKFENALLIYLLNYKQPRRIRLLENLLAGKKTVATLYWGYRYNLLVYLGVGKYLNITKFNYAKLQKQNLINKSDSTSYLLSKSGLIEQNKIDQVPTNYISFFQKFDVVRFKQRFLLFVQVVSQLEHQQSDYYVLNIGDIDKLFVKNYLTKFSKKNIAQQVKKEIYNFLNEVTDQEAKIFALELVGFNNNGSTLKQISDELNIDIFKLKFSEFNLFCNFCKRVFEKNNSIFRPLLNGLEKSFVNKNAIKSLNLYKSMHDVKKITKYQHIKESTFFEHLLETAICLPKNKFPYVDFLNRDDCDALCKIYGNNIDKWEYASLPSQIKERIPFFTFRLIEIFLTKEEREKIAR